MAQIRTPAEASDPASSRPHEESPSQASSGGPGHKRHVSPFWRHFLEMLAAMVVGMLVTSAIFLVHRRAQDLGRSDPSIPHTGTAGDGGQNDHPNDGLDAIPRYGTQQCL